MACKKQSVPKSRTINWEEKDIFQLNPVTSFMAYSLLQISLCNWYPHTVFKILYEMVSLCTFLGPSSMFCILSPMKRLLMCSKTNSNFTSLCLLYGSFLGNQDVRIKFILPRTKTAMGAPKGCFLTCLFWRSTVYTEHCSASRDSHTFRTHAPLLSYMNKYGLPWWAGIISQSNSGHMQNGSNIVVI